MDFDDGLSDEGAFLVIIPDGTGVKRAGGVAGRTRGQAVTGETLILKTKV